MKIRIKATSTIDERILIEYPFIRNYSPEIVEDNSFTYLFVNVETLQDLLDISKEVEHALIIETHWDDNSTIEIYDGYRE